MNQKDDQTQATTRKRSFAVVALPLVFFALLLLNLLPPMFLTSFEPETVAQPTILIMPFTVTDTSPELENSVSGIESGISTRLKETAGFQVILHSDTPHKVDPRSTTEQPEEAAEADFRVEGAIRGKLDNLEITVTLTRVSPQLQLWSRAFNGTTDEAALLQHDIATGIASTVRHSGTDRYMAPVE